LMLEEKGLTYGFLIELLVYFSVYK
jgi:hypothetical protein